MINKERIIGYDFQGWPIEKMNLREILSNLLEHDKENGVYTIRDDDPRLEVCPVVVEDDGMGYGVGGRYITSASFENNHSIIFAEEELKNIKLWIESKFQHGSLVTHEGEEYILLDIKNENGFMYQGMNLKTKEYKWLKENEIY